MVETKVGSFGEQGKPQPQEDKKLCSSMPDPLRWVQFCSPMAQDINITCVVSLSHEKVTTSTENWLEAGHHKHFVRSA